MLEEKWASLNLSGTTMEKLNLNFFYQLGSHLNPIVRPRPSKSDKPDRVGTIIHIFGLKPLINELFTMFPLNVCKNDATELLQAIDKCIDLFTKEDDINKLDSEIDFEFAHLANKAKEFEVVLSAELQTLATFHTEQKGIYSTPDLIEYAEKTLPPSVLAKIDDKTIDEIRYSGRCLAFDTPTASGFHILRATEAVLHRYYVVVCKPKSKTKTLNSWAAYITELKKSTNPDVQKVVAMLQQIKDLDRNLIMHPEVVLSPDEAFTLFETAKSVMMAMAMKLPEIKKHDAKKEKSPKA